MGQTEAKQQNGIIHERKFSGRKNERSLKDQIYHTHAHNNNNSHNNSHSFQPDIDDTIDYRLGTKVPLAKEDKCQLNDQALAASSNITVLAVLKLIKLAKANVKELKMINAREIKLEESHILRSEWIFASMVLDRFFLI